MANMKRWFAAALLCGLSIAAAAQERFIVMASTTSTEQSGLFAHLLPAFKAASGIEVRVVALGTGQALDMARRGDADVVFVHDTVAESGLSDFAASASASFNRWSLRRSARSDSRVVSFVNSMPSMSSVRIGTPS